MLFQYHRPCLSSTVPSLEEVDKYREDLLTLPVRPQISELSSFDIGDEEVDTLWNHALGFDNKEPLNAFLLLLKVYNRNPKGIVLLRRNAQDKFYLVGLLGSELQSIKDAEGELSKAYVHPERSLFVTGTPGLYKYGPLEMTGKG